MEFNGTFFLLDPFFTGRPGHGMNFGGGVAKAADTLGITMNMVADAGITEEAVSIYNALPVFSIANDLQDVRYRPAYHNIDPFRAAYRANLENLEPHLSRDDLLWDYYLYGPMQVDVYSSWLENIPENRRPRVMVGVDVYSELWFDWISPIADRLKRLEPWFRVTSTSFTNAKKIEDQIGVQAHWMPRPKMARPASEKIQDPEMVAKLSGGDRFNGPLVGYFTDPSILKSFNLLGDIIPRLLQETDLRFVLQIRGEPVEPECRESLAVLKETAPLYPGRLMFIEGMMEYDAYKTAIELCDGMIVAYDPKSHFANTPSGTICETLAVGTIPIVVEGTSMEKELRLFDIDIPVLFEQSAENFIHFLCEFEKNHKHWLERNKEQLANWNQFQSHENMFKHLFEKAWV